MLSPDKQDILLHQCLEAPTELGVLQFDPSTGQMVSWLWYVLSQKLTTHSNNHLSTGRLIARVAF